MRSSKGMTLGRFDSLSGFIALLFIAAVQLNGCSQPEYQPPKDAIPDIPPGRTNAMDDIAPPKK